MQLKKKASSGLVCQTVLKAIRRFLRWREVPGLNVDLLLLNGHGNNTLDFGGSIKWMQKDSSRDLSVSGTQELGNEHRALNLVGSLS